MGLYNNIIYQNLNYFDINDTNIKNNDIEYINTIMPSIKLLEYNEKNNIKESKYERNFQNHYNCPHLREQIHKNWNETNEIIKKRI